jgi:histidinol-phosphate aminotransferase
MTADFKSNARPEIRDLPVYSPGMDSDDVKRRYGVSEVIKLASNENPLGPSPRAVEALRGALEEASLYPDGACTALREKMAAMLGVDPARFIFGNGTDEVIDLVFFAFFNHGDVALMGEPTFSSYFLSGEMMGAVMCYEPLCGHRHHVDNMLSLVNERTKALFVGTPHNPTGTICTGDELDRLLSGLPPDILLVWDEAYFEYVDDPGYPDSIGYLDAYPNLMVLRTFSKCYGLAGLRIGYGIAHPEVIGLLEKVRPPFNVNRLAQVAALAALDDDEHVRRSRQVNAEGRDYLFEQLEGMKMEPVPTQANFILFRYSHLVDGLPEKLLERGIIVRDGGALGYPGYIRMTVGTPGQNRAVVEAIRDIVIP